MNRVVIEGRLGRDAELIYTNSGTALTKFSVATDNNKRDGDKWVKLDPTWFDVTVWGNLAERAGHLHKGDQVHIEGKFQVNSYEKDGQTRKSYDVVANSIHKVMRLVTEDTSTAGASSEEDLPGF